MMVLGLLSCGPAAALQDASGKALPEPVSIEAIPERVQQTAAIVRAAINRARPQEGLSAIERDEPKFSEGCRALITTTRQLLRTDRSPWMTDNLSSAWTILRHRVMGWNAAIRERNAGLQQDLLLLRQEANVWRSTRDGAGEDTPGEVLQQIDGTLDSIQEAERAVLARRNTLLALQSAVARLGIDLDRLDEELAAAAAAGRESLLRLDGPPVWKPAPAAQPEQEVQRPKGPPAGVLREVAAYYLRSLGTIIAGHTAIFAALLALLLAARRRAAPWRSDPHPAVRGLGFVIGHPLSTAILLTALAGAVLYADAPQFLLNLSSYLMLIPLLRIVPGIISPAVKPAVWLLAGLYVADGIVVTLPAYASSTRIALLVITTATGAGLWWMERRVRARLEGHGWTRAAAGVIRLGLLLLGVSALAEVAGATGLARFLTTGVLRSVYGAVMLYGALLAARGALEVLLRLNRGSSLIRDEAALARLGQTLSASLNWAGAMLFGAMALRSFSLTDLLLARVRALMQARVGIGAIEFTLGSAAAIVLIVLASALLSKVLRFFLSAGLYGQMSLQRGTGESISKILHYVVLTGGFLLALGAAGIDMTRFTMLAGALGVGVGFGLQNIINNFMSGLILLFERPLHVGDKLTVGDTSGEVVDIGIRASTIRTWDGADVVIPNASLISGDFTNWTLSDDRRRDEFSVGVAYGTNPERVMELLRSAAASHPLVLTQPEPVALFTAFGESSLDFTLRYWTLLAHCVEARSGLHVAVERTLAQAGIEIPFPQRDVNIKGSAAQADLQTNPGGTA